ncbi:MAG: hypothetical protein M1816_000520 [Peltula sp. TS41687]|nr:MAG: hypothetical protein M1816_000520 [Peltula sp. TS41687]
MKSTELSPVFVMLSIFGFYLLWILMWQNGTLDAIDLAIRQRRFADGTPLKTVYTGIGPVDEALSMVVAFTYYPSNGHDISARLLYVDIASTLQTAALWCLVDSLRRGRRSLLLAIPWIWGLLWNAIGAGVILPLYIFVHVRSIPRKDEIPLEHAKVLIPTILLSSYLPAILTTLPSPTSRSPSGHQTIIALFQTTPVWVAVLQHMLCASLTMISPARAGRANADIGYVRGAYGFGAVLSALGHLYVLRGILLSDSTIRQVYLPSTSQPGMSSGEKILAQGATIFLQYDWMIINVSALLWSYLLVRKQVKRIKVSTCVAAVVVNAAVGPGALVSGVLGWREGKIRTINKASD